jgi:2-iminobutanoate/2-iminopropanoate deaminase
MAKKIIATKDAPSAIGPYSQAVRAGPFLFASGQIPIDPETGHVVEGDITVQTRRVLENLKAVLSGADLSFSDVVKTTIFITDMSQFSSVNEIYGEYFPFDPPARSTVEVTRLPKDVAIEIEMVAYANKGKEKL